MAFTEHVLPTFDGLKLYVRDYAPERPGRFAPVVCIPGLTRNSADFDVVAPSIAALGRRVLAFDLRGRSLSECAIDARSYRPDVYASDVLFILDALGIGTAVFIGTSLGGIVTMMAAISGPEFITAAVLNDIGPVVETAGLARIASYVGNVGPYESWSALIEAVKASQGPDYPLADERFWEVFARRVAHELPDGRVVFSYDPAIAEGLSAARDAPAPRLLPLFQALAVKPVLSVRGALSDVLSPDGVAAMRQSKPDLETVEIPNVGHAPTLEEPDAWEAVVAFLGRVP